MQHADMLTFVVASYMHLTQLTAHMSQLLMFVKLGVFQCDVYTFTDLTLLVWHPEGHLASSCNP